MTLELGKVCTIGRSGTKNGGLIVLIVLTKAGAHCSGKVLVITEDGVTAYPTTFNPNEWDIYPTTIMTLNQFECLWNLYQ